MGREDEIRLIAYNIWKAQDCLDGHDSEHWFQAEAIWEDQNKKTSAISSNMVINRPFKQTNQKGLNKKNSPDNRHVKNS